MIIEEGYPSFMMMEKKYPAVEEPVEHGDFSPWPWEQRAHWRQIMGKSATLNDDHHS